MALPQPLTLCLDKQPLLKVALVGANGGIGRALIHELQQRYPSVDIAATYRRTPADIKHVRWAALEVTDEQAVAEWLQSLGDIDWLINCVGVLHSEQHQPEKSIRQFNPDWFMQSMSVNCMPTLLLAKYAQQVLKRSENPVFATVSARVGSIADNQLGGWHSYRTSKAALNMALKCLAIEWERTLSSARVLSLHPGTTDTELSKPFQKRVPEAQLFSAKKTAGFLIDHIADAHQHESGRFIAWDGQTIPW